MFFFFFQAEDGIRDKLVTGVQTCALPIFRPAVGTEIFFSSSTTISTARSIPRLSDIGFEPAVTDFRPSRNTAWASTVAVVVPSPARSDVLVATSFTIWAPMFSIGSSSSISFATVTPSFVTVGLPNFLSMTRSEEHTSELQSLAYLVCRLLLEKKKK